jgi:hypothetical protein
MGRVNVLRRLGYLNIDTAAADIGELPGKVYRTRTAWCYSQHCAKSKEKVLKIKVNLKEVYCPDCRHALVWETKEEIK